MNSISKFAIVTVFLGLSFVVRAETPQPASGVPAFAVAKLSIRKMGVFLDQNAAFANQIMPNSGPLAKMFIANLLFKLPVDESLNFDGPAQLYILAPLTFGANQDMASILPVGDAVKLKKNIASVYGEPTEKSGALAYVLPQGLTQDDKTLLVKILNGKALLATSPDVLKQLELIAATPPAAGAPFAGGADAELIIDVPAVRKIFGNKIEAALQVGAFLAAENVGGLTKVSDQLDKIIKSLWQVGSVELRMSYDANSAHMNLELAIVPLPDSHLADAFAAPPAALEGKNTALLVTGAPINAAFRVNGKAFLAAVQQFGLDIGTKQNDIGPFLDLLSGESALAIYPANGTVLLSQRTLAGAPLAKKAEAVHAKYIEMGNREISRSGTGTDKDLYMGSTEAAEHNGVKTILYTSGTRANLGKPAATDKGRNEFLATAEMGEHSFLSMGKTPLATLNKLIELSQAKAPVTPELSAAFNAPPPGTLVMVAVNVLEVGRVAGAVFLPNRVAAEQIVGGLKDDPIVASLFVYGGKAGLRVSIPGTTAGSLYVVYVRLRRSGIDPLGMLGIGGPKQADDDKTPGNIPPPPPEK